MQNYLPQRRLLEARYNKSRHNLLLVLIFTVINIVLLVTNANSYFLFSAYVPYMLVDLGMDMCGMYPAEYYGADYSEYVFLNPSFFAICLGIAIVILAMYLLSWIFSKKARVGWLIFSVVFFVLDFIILLLVVEINSSIMIDIVFHVWVIVSLMMGIISHFKLKKLPVEEIVVDETEEVVETEAGEEVAAEEATADLEVTEEPKETEQSEEVFH